MPDMEHKVIYKAVADFGTVIAQAAALRAELNALEGKTGKVGSGSSGGAANVSKSFKAATEVVDAHTKAIKKNTEALDENGKTEQEVARERREQFAFTLAAAKAKLTGDRRGELNRERENKKADEQEDRHTKKLVKKTKEFWEDVDKEDWKHARRKAIADAAYWLSVDKEDHKHTQRQAKQVADFWADVEKEDWKHTRRKKKADGEFWEDVDKETWKRNSKLRQDIAKARYFADREDDDRTKRLEKQLVKEAKLAEKAFKAMSPAQHLASVVGSVYRKATGNQGKDPFEAGAAGQPPTRHLLTGLYDMGENFDKSFANVGKKLFSFKGLIALAVVALGPLVAMLGALGAAAIGAANIMVSLAGSVAALPGLLFAAATGIGSIVVALTPMMAVFKAYSAQQKQVLAGTAQLAQAHRDAANKVSDAQHAYASASKAVVDAQFNEQRSQQSLNDARRDATRDLQDLMTELGRASLTEEGAILALQRAQQSYRQTGADPNSTLLDRQEALHRVKVAENDLADTRTKNQRLAIDVNQAEQRGVEGSTSVISARKAVADSTFATANAIYSMQKATQDLALAQKEQAAGGSAVYQANQALAAALEKLGPVSRTVALALLAQAGAWHKVQVSVGEAFFTPMLSQLGNMTSVLPILNDLLTKSGAAMGQVAADGLEMITSGPWKQDFADLAVRNATLLDNFGHAALLIADAFRNITVAAAPFTEWISVAIRGIAKDFDDWSAKARQSGAISSFLETTKTRLQAMGKIVGNLFHVLSSLFFASSDFSGSMLDSIVKVTDKWAKWSAAQEQTGSSFKQWLTDVKPLLRDVSDFVGEVVKGFGRIAADPKNMQEASKILDTLAYKIMPKIVSVFTELSQSHLIGNLLDVLGSGLGVIDSVLRSLSPILGNPVVAGTIKIVADGFVALGIATFVGKYLGFFKVITALKWLAGTKTGWGFLEKIFGTKLATTLFGGLVGPAQIAADTQLAAARIAATAAATQLDAALIASGGKAVKVTEKAATLLPDAVKGGVVGTVAARLLGGVRVLGGGSLTAGAAVVAGTAAAVVGGVQSYQDAPSRTTPGGAAKQFFTPRSAKDPSLVNIAGDIGKYTTPVGLGAFAAGAFVKDGGFAKLWHFVTTGELPDTSPLKGLGGKIAGLGKSALGAVVGVFEGIGDWFSGLGKSTGGWVSQHVVHPVEKFFAGIGSWFSGIGKSVGSWFNQFLIQPVRRSVMGLLHWLEPFWEIIKGIGRFFKWAGGQIAHWVNTHVIRPVVNFFVAIGSWIAGAASSIGSWINDNVIQPVVGFFVAIGSWITGAATLIGSWINDHVISPVVNFFVTIGAWISNTATSIGTWINDHVIQPIVGFFTGIGEGISNTSASVGSWINDHVIQPTVNFFAAIGSWFAALPGYVSAWVSSNVINPVSNFFSSIGDFFAKMPSRIQHWAHGLPGIGRFIEDAPAGSYASGDVVAGASDGQVDRKLIWATPGEFLTRKRVVDKPMGKRLLRDLNEERLDPASFYQALNMVHRGSNIPVNSAARIASSSTVVNNSNTRNAGLNVGDVTINNPIRERSDRSMRRTLQTLAFMGDH